jgi:two-component system LytT family response regulator
VIFTTAYDEYAIKAFEFNALDYLLKPIELHRLSEAIQKVEEEFERQNKFQILPKKEHQF